MTEMKPDEAKNLKLFSLTSILVVEDEITTRKSMRRLLESFSSDLGEAAVLHDIGKLVIPDAILKQPGLVDALLHHYTLFENTLAAGNESV